MELTPFTIYLIMQADTVASVFAGTVFVGALTTGILAVTTFILWGEAHPRAGVEFEQEKIMFRKAFGFLRATAVITVFASMVAALTPSTKTLVAMYSVPTAIEIAEDIELGETAKKTVEAVNKLLDGYLEAK